MSLAKRVAGSSALLVGIKFVHRLLGLFSTLILARLLTPADFGLVALISITVYFFDVLSSAGSDQYIIRKRNVTEDDLNTAWTLDLLMKIFLWLLLLIIASSVAEFFSQPDLERALQLGSCVLPLNALASPRINLLKQEFAYQGIFWLSVIQRVSGFFIVVGLAWHLRNFWAMVIADVAASVVFTLGTYRIAAHRPRLTLLQLSDQWSFSAWMLLRGIVGYTRSQIDTLFVSKLFPATSLGQYQLARDIAMLPAHNIVVPASEQLLAAFRESRGDRAAQGLQLRWSFAAVAVLIFPTCTFVTVFARNIVSVLLGEQWSEAESTLAYMSLLLFYFSFSVVYERLLVAEGRVRLLSALETYSLVVVIASLLFAAGGNTQSIALFRGVAGCANLLVFAIICQRATRLPGCLPLAMLTIFSIASLLAAFVATSLAVSSDSATVELLTQTALFSVTYTGAVLIGSRFLTLEDKQRIDTLIASRLASLKMAVSRT
ncbi:MAG: lipopolysaccharide biosynthesis protein [Congregibacter sp.]